MWAQRPVVPSPLQGRPTTDVSWGFPGPQKEKRGVLKMMEGRAKSMTANSTS